MEKEKKRKEKEQETNYVADTFSSFLMPIAWERNMHIDSVTSDVKQGLASGRQPQIAPPLGPDRRHRAMPVLDIISRGMGPSEIQRRLPSPR